jgi:hypothetical protein
MTLITKTQIKQLTQNGEVNFDGRTVGDFRPVVKLFTPDASATWLLTELMPNDPDLAFGLCDIGLGCPELGYVRLSELHEVRGKLGLAVERDRFFSAQHPLSVYLESALAAGRIIT